MSPVHRLGARAAPSASASTSTQASSSAHDTAGKPFQRLRSSLESTLRTATRSRSKPVPVPASVDDFATVREKGKEKEKEKSKERGREGDGERGRESSEDAPKEHKERERSRVLRKLESKVNFRASPPPKDDAEKGKGKGKEKKERAAGHTSYTTPSLRGASMSSPHLAPPPSSKPIPIPTPTKDRTRRGSMAPPTISGPSALGKAPSVRRSAPPPLTSPSLASVRHRSPSPGTARHRSPSPGTARHRARSPDSPTPHKGGSSLFASPPASPASPTSPTSPTMRARSPPQRGASQRGLTSASTSHLPAQRATSPEPDPRTASPTARRPSVEIRRASGERARSPASPAFDTTRRASGERARSPTSPSSYAQQHARAFNASTTSLAAATATPEQRELLRSSAAILCRELRRAPPGVGAGAWAEVEARLGPLARLERVWGSGILGREGSGGKGAGGGVGGGGGEERERRVFCEALRDGFVLCHLMNKLRPNTIAPIDARDDGLKRTANITRFLAACAAQGVPASECFYKDDLAEGAPEALARVARTVISAVKVVEAPWIAGGGLRREREGVYGSQGRAAASVPNLALQRAVSPSPTTPARKRWSPPEPQLATVSDGGSGTGTESAGKDGNGRTTPVAAPPTLTPRSPLRVHTASPMPESPTRASMLSNTTTELSAYSSLFDRAPAAGNKFGTMRTATTEATSLDMPSFGRADGAAAAEELALARPRRASKEPPRRERRPSESLAGVAEDDGADVFTAPRTRPIAIRPAERGHERAEPLSASPSPPRKLAYVRSGSVESVPRRPTGLAPREALRRDISPDGLSASAPGPRVMLRRASTKTGGARSGSLVPRGDLDEARASRELDPPVPFPRSAPGDASPPAEGHERPRQVRGRFQSDIEGRSTRRKDRPDSFDEMGERRPQRARFESMVNLGVVSSNASASDLLSRDSMDVRQTLIVRETGKPPTHFQLGNCIGRGQFGSVYRALNLNTGQMVAVKRIRLEGLKEDEVMQLMKEVDLVKSLSHPSIVKYEGMARDENTLSIVLEYAENGSLGQTLKAFGKLNESLVASYVVKILEGLHYLHGSDVVHCDLKAANILTTKNGNVKLSDFGVSLNLRAMEREIKDVAGTPNWMAPEVIELKGASTKSDIWSLGATVIELLTGRPPYAEIANGMSVMFRIVEDEMPPLPEGASPMLEDFLTQCFNKDPALRPSAELLCEHEWLKKSWSGLKDLRPQDSIPFLRRVSTDFQKSEAQHLFTMPEGLSSPTEDERPPHEFFIGTPPLAIPRRFSNEPSSPVGTPGTPDDSISPRDHSFVKTTFGKLCLLVIKKSAVLCESCSLIAHSKCAASAPMTCDLRSQLLEYAHFAQTGSPSGVYASSMDILKGGGLTPTSPSSDVAFVPGPPSSKMSAETSPAPGSSSPISGSPARPPTAYKFMAFKSKRSHGSMSPDLAPTQASSSTSLLPAGSEMRTQSNNQETKPKVEREKTVLRKKPSMLWRGRETVQQRPQSFSSDSTSPNTASMRSAADSLSSNVDLQKKAGAPAPDANAGKGLPRTRRISTTAANKPSHRVSASITSTTFTEDQEEEETYRSELPGGLDNTISGHRKKDSNCAIQ
ncbi:hypothetical protein HWV62_27520 [Athelia sp. TMB]|nr:hypothetical protein HWV62_27520 [Athelia sp. TMB]